MEICNLKDEVKVLGVRVKTFPLGIGDAFEKLIKVLPEGLDRSYYGIAYMTEDGEIVYKAAAEERYEGEAEKYSCEEYTIEKGNYLMEVVRDWRKKTDCIKDVFHEMMQDNRFDNTKPCIEWYKNDDEMVCMIKSKV